MTEAQIKVEIQNLISKLSDTEKVFPISEEEVKLAWRQTRRKINSKTDLFTVLCTLNLLNAAMKNKDLKQLIYYAEIKINVARVINLLISLPANTYDIDIYINPAENNCAYIEIYGIQFSFHNISVNEAIKNFIQSEANLIKEWQSIRLQRIASPLFNLAISLR